MARSEWSDDSATAPSVGNGHPVALTDLISLQELQTVQNAFAEATGVASIITNVDGTPLTEPSNFCRLCQHIIRGTEKGRANCYHSDAVLGRMKPGGPAMQPCLSGGLWDAGTSIRVGERHIANWLIGQVLEEPVDADRMLAYAREIGADEEEFRRALDDVTRMPLRQFEKVTEALHLIATQLSQLAFRNYQQAQFIGEREQAAQALRASEQRFRSYIENAPEALFVVGADGVFLDCNPAACALLGYSREELLDLTIYACLSADRSVADGIRAELTGKGQIRNTEIALRHKDGHAVDVELTAARLDGERLIGFCKDVTGRKEIEEQLRHAQKMESVGRLAGGVAHDFNNMLGVIIGHVEFALGQVGPDHPLHRHLSEVHAAAERSAALARQLLAFARRQTAAPQVVDLNAQIDGTHAMLRRLVGENIDVRWQPAAYLWSVRIDPSQVDQILTNLVVNARDAITDVGSITIATDNVTLNEAYCEGHVDATPGEYVRLSVSDTGVGMDATTLSHIFEPFYTTKEVGKGTGLGLATVYGIVRQNEGHIEATSTPGCTTSFRVYLPRVGEPGAGHDSAATALKAPPVGTETVLLVEDEDAILGLVAMLLEREGYRVLANRRPHDALRQAREYEGPIHLVVSDVVMPEMNGRQLRDELRKTFPHLKCIFMSGYPADVIAKHGVLEDGVHFLAKPFSAVGLAAKVREVLEGE